MRNTIATNIPRQVAEYYAPVVNESALIPEAGLVQFMTGDHLSPPVVATAAVDRPGEWVEATRARVLELGNKLNLNERSLAVDLGNGIGAPGRDLTKAFGSTIIGINITFSQLNSLRRLSAEKESDYSRVINADMQNLPLLSSSTDAVFSVNAMYHAPSYSSTLNEAARVLKTGGRLGIDDWFTTPLTSDETLKDLRERWFSPVGFHQIEDLKAYAISIGLQLVMEDDYTADLAAFLSEENFGRVYDEQLAALVVSGFNKLYGYTYPEYIPEHAEQAAREQREIVLSMGDLYRNGQAVYKQLIFEKKPSGA